MAGDADAIADDTADSTEQTDVAVLESGREEGRTVLDHQLRLLSDIHARAMRTVRITILVLGVVVSAATVTPAIRFVNWLTVGGVGSLLLSILFGLVTYGAAGPKLGAGRSYLQEARKEGYDESEWLDTLVGGYREWNDQMSTLLTSNALTLTLTQVALGLGIVMLALGVLFEATG